MIDRQIRCLVEIETNHRKLGNFGFKGLILSLPFRGRLFLAVSYYYGLREKVGTSFLLPRRAYFRLYDSYNRFRQVEEDGSATGRESVAVAPSSPSPRPICRDGGS